MNSNPLIEKIRQARLFSFDLDGTTILGSKPLKGVKELLEYLFKHKKVVFMTNNSSKTNAMHAEHLSKIFDMKIDESRLMSALDSMELFLKERSFKRIYPFLNERVRSHLSKEFIFDDVKPDVIVVGFNTDATYSQLQKVSRLIFEDIPYILVHPDLRCPTDFGYIPDAGSFAKIFELTTQRKPLWIGGKPNHTMIKGLVNKYDVDEEEIVYVGDRLYTDVEMVRKSEACGVLVLTGETSLEEFKRYEKRTHVSNVLVVENAEELLKVISNRVFKD